MHVLRPLQYRSPEEDTTLYRHVLYACEAFLISADHHAAVLSSICVWHLYAL